MDKPYRPDGLEKRPDRLLTPRARGRFYLQLKTSRRRALGSTYFHMRTTAGIPLGPPILPYCDLLDSRGSESRGEISDAFSLRPTRRAPLGPGWPVAQGPSIAGCDEMLGRVQLE
jgi:hypothetical protein